MLMDSLTWNLLIMLFLISLASWVYIIMNQRQLRKLFQKTLLIIAHPDDESMFFTPTLANVPKGSVHILCLSTGNADGLGRIRIAELEKVANYFGAGLRIVDDERLQDGMRTDWDIRVIKDYIEEEVQTIGADILLTFDEYGVSGHWNHIAVSKASRLVLKGRPGISLYFLETTGIIRKYIGMLDGIFSSRGITFILPHFLTSWKAMATHASQFVWYRRLFVVFSRYSYINTLVRVNE